MNPFKSKTGKWLTYSLFVEYSTVSPEITPMYTTKREDHKSFPSLYRLYMEENDPTEYNFAVKHLGGWSHWKELCTKPFLKDIVSEWREEMSLRTKSQALASIIAVSLSTLPTKLQASKMLLDGCWEVKKDTVGRPSKETIRQKADELVQSEKEILQDYERLN